MKCPFSCNQYGDMSDCQESSCVLSDEAGNCLVQQALQCYVSAERTRVAEENARLHRETELVKTYWAMKKDGTRTPIQFIERGDPLPDNVPHGTMVIEEY